MRDRLLSRISQLCLLFPPLKPSINYSDVLSNEEVVLFVAFVNGHISEIIKNPDKSVQDEQLSRILKSSVGLPRIKPADVLYVESLLASASGNEVASSKFKDIVLFLRDNRKVWWSLHDAYEKIVRNSLVGTCPLVIANPPFIVRLFGLHRFEEFHKFFHESIHCVLEDNGICFHDEALDEGLVVYLHQQVMGKHVCSLHYAGKIGSLYLNYADRFEKLFGRYPKNELISSLKYYSELWNTGKVIKAQ